MRSRKLLFILPNLFTVTSILGGFYAMTLCSGDAGPTQMYQAALAILFAMFFDGFDGRVARMTRTQSDFGMQLDSLADVVSFGAAPGLLVYKWALEPLGFLGLFLSFAFVACGALRLARFNVQTGAVDKRFFIGLPTPAGAGVLASTVILLNSAELSRWELVALATGSYIVALLMVSTFRYWSFKDVDAARRRPMQTLLVVILAVMVVATNHEWFLFLGFVGYAVSGPLSWLVLGRTAPVPAPELLTKDSH